MLYLGHANITPTEVDPAAVCHLDVFYAPDYVAAGRDFDTTRKAGFLAADLREHPATGAVLAEPAPATRADLERIHDGDYVEAVLTGEPRSLAASAGLGWDPGLVTAILSSTGGCIDAARSAWTHGIAGTLSSGLHHARRDSGAGYCTINGLALAALTFLDLGARRVLIVDVDAHHGGGTHDILGTDDRITQLDVSTDGYDAYAPHDGWTTDLVDDAADYLPTVAARLGAIDPATIGAVVLNAGMDPHEHCDTGGLHGIDAEVLAERDQLVFEWATTNRLPIAFALAGGYTGVDLDHAQLTTLHRLTIEAASRTLSTTGAPT